LGGISHNPHKGDGLKEGKATLGVVLRKGGREGRWEGGREERKAVGREK